MDTPKLSQELTEALSRARLAPYYRQGDTFEQAYQRYVWNVRLSEAMLPALNYLEIILRNKVDKLICRHFGQNWLVTLPASLRLNDSDKDKITDTIERFTREYRRAPHHDDIIAQINFGFWCAFFHKRYDPILWHRKHAITDVFPALPREKRTRRTIEQMLFLIKKLRNRIAHHEPIWNMKPTVKEIHSECHALIGSMSPAALDTLLPIDRLPQLWEG